MPGSGHAGGILGVVPPETRLLKQQFDERQSVSSVPSSRSLTPETTPVTTPVTTPGPTVAAVAADVRFVAAAATVGPGVVTGVVTGVVSGVSDREDGTDDTDCLSSNCCFTAGFQGAQRPGSRPHARIRACVVRDLVK